MRLLRARLLARYVGAALFENPRTRLMRLTLQLWVFDVEHRDVLRASNRYNAGRARHDEAWYERSIITDEIDALESRRLLRRAYHFDVDVAVGPDDWDESSSTGTRSLTGAKSRELRKAIHVAEAERRAIAESWVKILAPIVTAIVGLVGTAIGFIAVLRK